MSAAADPTRAVPEPRRGAGFSLIEVLIALSILLVGGVSILAVFALAASHGIERRVEAGLDRLRAEAVTVAQESLDAAPPGRPPPPIVDRPTSQAGFTMSVEYVKSPNGDPAWVARISIAYRGSELRQGLLPPVWLVRSTLDPSVLEKRGGP